MRHPDRSVLLWWILVCPVFTHTHTHTRSSCLNSLEAFHRCTLSLCDSYCWHRGHVCSHSKLSLANCLWDHVSLCVCVCVCVCVSVRKGPLKLATAVLMLVYYRICIRVPCDSLDSIHNRLPPLQRTFQTQWIWLTVNIIVMSLV